MTDACLRLWMLAQQHFPLDFPTGAHVLEIGCAEDDWQTPMLAQRPDLHITGIDWRECDRPGHILRGDVLTARFPPNSFDAIVGISSIEHIGLGHYNADPIDPDGDTHVMLLACQWLKLGGWIYADVPYDKAGYRVEGTAYRVYDLAAIRSRLIVPGLCLTTHTLQLSEDGSLNYALLLAERAAPAPAWTGAKPTITPERLSIWDGYVG